MLSASTQAIALLPGVDEFEIVKERYLEKGLDDAPVLLSFIHDASLVRI